MISQISLTADPKAMAMLKQFGKIIPLSLLRRSVMQAANLVQTEWVGAIQKSGAPAGWKTKYIEAINQRIIDELTIDVYAEKSLFVNIGEEGVKRFDMKPGLLSGPHVKQGKNGPYTIVMLRKGAPGAQYMKPLPKEVYEAAKQLKKGQTLKGFENLGKYSRIITVKKSLKKESMAEIKSGIYSGLRKLGSRGHTTYGTFRVVSRKSVGWIYPGVKGSRAYSITSRTIETKMRDFLINNVLQEGLNYMEQKMSGK